MRALGLCQRPEPVGDFVQAPVAGGLSERYSGFFLTGIFLVGHLIVLAFGWAWLAGQVGASAAWGDGVAPFLLPAFPKSVAAAAIVWLANSRRPKVASL